MPASGAAARIASLASISAVASASTQVVASGISRRLVVIRSAMVRRTPRNGMCRSSADTGRPRHGDDGRGTRRVRHARARGGGGGGRRRCAGMMRAGETSDAWAIAASTSRRRRISSGDAGVSCRQVDPVVAGEAPHDRRDDLDRPWSGVCAAGADAVGVAVVGAAAVDPPTRRAGCAWLSAVP